MSGHAPASWDALASRFDDEVCHVLAEDRRKVVARTLAREARRLKARHPTRRLHAADFGCGTGRALPLLARHFDHVLATDVSPACLAVASGLERLPARMRFLQANLGRPRIALPVPKPGVDLGLCVNVAIMPHERVRDRVLANVARHLRPRGRLLLVVPALESQLLVRRRFREWTGSRWRTGRTRDERPVEGLFDVGGAITKAWTCEELESLGPRLSCRTVSVDRVEYAWTTEFERPPRSMREPWPFDWLAVLERNAER